LRRFSSADSKEDYENVFDIIANNKAKEPATWKMKDV